MVIGLRRINVCITGYKKCAGCLGRLGRDRIRRELYKLYKGCNYIRMKKSISAENKKKLKGKE